MFGELFIGRRRSRRLLRAISRCFTQYFRASSIAAHCLDRCQGDMDSKVSMYHRMSAARVRSPAFAAASTLGSLSWTSRFWAQAFAAVFVEKVFDSLWMSSPSRVSLKAGPACPLSCYDCGHHDLPIVPRPFGDKFGTIASDKRPGMPGSSGEMTVSESSGKTGGKLDLSALEAARRISVAPMMDWGD